MELPVVIHPNDLLRAKTEFVTEINQEILDLLDNMQETMSAQDGVGIAAPQVGSSLRLAVVQVVPEDEAFYLINPVITKKEGSDIFVEGCLSIPHVFGTVERADKIVVEFYDREGTHLAMEAYGYFARAIQHEVDHLDGILFIDKMIDEIKEEDLESYYEQYELEHGEVEESEHD
ncbi:MAG: peptide deformylase [Lactobacillales bacterium]|jgi:peptide deformylase|nr:peptide deformylase [Lactobacillales bacterium]